jgi:hypothetical protein
MSSPVVVGDRVFCVNRFLYCLDLTKNLAECYRQRDPALSDYGAIIADDNRLLIVGKGELLLLDSHSDQFRLVSLSVHQTITGNAYWPNRAQPVARGWITGV